MLESLRFEPAWFGGVSVLWHSELHLLRVIASHPNLKLVWSALAACAGVPISDFHLVLDGLALVNVDVFAHNLLKDFVFAGSDSCLVLDLG